MVENLGGGRRRDFDPKIEGDREFEERQQTRRDIAAEKRQETPPPARGEVEEYLEREVWSS